MNDFEVIRSELELAAARALLDRARDALPNAYARYSGFAVAAAVRTVDGRLHVGVNVENASYGLTICAERNAVLAAVTQGITRIAAVAVVCSAGGPCIPCGACRQVIAEFADGDTAVYLESAAGHACRIRFGDLLPHPFALER